MRRSLLVVSALLMISTHALAQTASTDSQTLQALLAEVRQLRQELQTTTVAVQRAQILLYRLQTQEGVLARAMQRLDDAHARIAEAQAERKRLEAELKFYQDFIGRPETAPTERKEMEKLLPVLKAKLDALGVEEQQRLAKEMDADQQLRIEQGKLSDLQSQLDRLDQELQNSIRQPVRSPH